MMLPQKQTMLLFGFALFLLSSTAGMMAAEHACFNRGRVEMMKTQNSFWTHYKTSDPISHKILPKPAYCEVAASPALKRLLVAQASIMPKSIEQL